MESPVLKKIEHEAENLTQAQILDLVVRLLEIAKARGKESNGPIEWGKYVGSLTHGPDPLEYQRTIRSEWDDSSGH